MRKEFCLTTVLLVSMVVFLSCQKTNLLEPQSNDENVVVTLAKKPPKVSTLPYIESFFIEEYSGSALIRTINIVDKNDLVFTETNEPIDFSTYQYKVHYNVTHVNDINYVRVMMFYDLNNDGEPDFSPLESKPWLFRDEYEGTNDTDISKTELWDGTVIESIWDRILEYPNDRYQLYDQLATYDDGGRTDGADKYGFFIWAGNDNGDTEKRFTLWIKAANSPVNQYHVGDITFDTVPAKGNSVQVNANVTIDGSSSAPLDGVYVYGKWSGIYQSNSVYRAGPSVNGMVTFEGPKIKNNASGVEIFTIETIKAQYSAYNPWENENSNTLWTWPNVSPFKELEF